MVTVIQQRYREVNLWVIREAMPPSHITVVIWSLVPQHRELGKVVVKACGASLHGSLHRYEVEAVKGPFTRDMLGPRVSPRTLEPSDIRTLVQVPPRFNRHQRTTRVILVGFRQSDSKEGKNVQWSYQE